VDLVLQVLDSLLVLTDLVEVLLLDQLKLHLLQLYVRLHLFYFDLTLLHQRCLLVQVLVPSHDAAFIVRLVDVIPVICIVVCHE